MKAQNQEDQKLLARFGYTNDQIWLLKLFQKYEHLIIGVCLKYSQDQDWSKDLTAQIYEKMVAKSNGLKVESFKNWLYTLSKNHCIDELRKKGRRISTLEKYRNLQIQEEDLVYFSPEERLIIEEDRAHKDTVINLATNILSTQQRECIELFYQQRLSYLEISRQTGLPLNRIKSHLQNGKNKMKRYILEHYNIDL